MKHETDGTIIQFLHGSHSFEGVWFGDKHPEKKGLFWWRKELDKYIEAKWKEACDRQYTNCLRAVPDEAPQKYYDAVKDAPIPEFKP